MAKSLSDSDNSSRLNRCLRLFTLRPQILEGRVELAKLHEFKGDYPQQNSDGLTSERVFRQVKKLGWLWSAGWTRTRSTNTVPTLAGKSRPILGKPHRPPTGSPKRAPNHPPPPPYPPHPPHHLPRRGQALPSAPASTTPRTPADVLALESHCAAARIGFATRSTVRRRRLDLPLRRPDPVDGARLPGAGRGVPTGGAPGAAISFDGAGLDHAAIVPCRPGARPAPPGQPRQSTQRNPPVHHRLVRLGATPLHPPRRRRHPATALYIMWRWTVAPWPPPASARQLTYAGTPRSRGRHIVCQAGEHSGDSTTNPSPPWSGPFRAPLGAGTQWGISPVFCVQYLSLHPA